MSALVKPEPRAATMDDMRAFAEAAVRSKFYGFGSADQMLPLMMVAQSQGRSFVSVVEEYSVIQGRPALKAEAMLARFQKAGGHIKWIELSDTRCAAVFSHAQCDPVEVDWDINRAKQAGIFGKDNWKKYPRQMLKARVISDGVRLAYPACLGGMYTPEEVQDFEPAVTPSSRPAIAHATPHVAALTEAGAGDETQPAPVSSSMKASFTTDENADGLGKGKSAYQAKKDGDWEKVSERLLEELANYDNKADAKAWWEKTVHEDEEYKNLPRSWRQLFKETEIEPRLEALL